MDSDIKTHKILSYVAFMSLIMGFVAIGILTFWSIYPYKVMDIKNSPFPVINKEVERGELLLFEMDFCKYTNESSEIQRRFIDGLVHVMPLITGTNETGCRKLIISDKVPKNLPPGEYIMDFKYTYKVNPIRTVTVSAKTEKFIVKE